MGPSTIIGLVNILFFFVVPLCTWLVIVLIVRWSMGPEKWRDLAWKVGYPRSFDEIIHPPDSATDLGLHIKESLWATLTGRAFTRSLSGMEVFILVGESFVPLGMAALAFYFLDFHH
jgi:hypothetical protein